MEDDKFIQGFEADVWLASGRSLSELRHIIRCFAQEVFVEAMRPTEQQIAQWRANGIGRRGLAVHITARSGKILNCVTVERLWRYYARQKHPRRTRTITEYNLRLSQPRKCRHCGTEAGLFHTDHVVPLVLGGEDREENLQVLCSKCNLKKGGNIDPFTIYIGFED